jgi:pimeloyl-ACP methyl ester carboxylesterase
MTGFLAGKSIFVHQFAALSEQYTVYALDCFGVGASDHPYFKARNSDEAEAFFAIPLEKWRQAQGIDRFSLLGHSFGELTRHPRQSLTVLFSFLLIFSSMNKLAFFLSTRFFSFDFSR